MFNNTLYRCTVKEILLLKGDRNRGIQTSCLLYPLIPVSAPLFGLCLSVFWFLDRLVLYRVLTILFVLVVNGGYSPWSDWTQCTVTCGGGESMRSRTCTNPSPEFGGKDCSSLGSSTETMKCKNDPCPGKLCTSHNAVIGVIMEKSFRKHGLQWRRKGDAYQKS